MMAVYTSRDLKNGWVGRPLGVRPYEEARLCLNQGEHLLAHVKVPANELIICVDADDKFTLVEQKASVFTLYAVTDEEYRNFLS